MRNSKLFLSIAASLTFAISACAKQSTKEAADPLAYVPADTPYVFANLEPLPKQQIEEWIAKMQPMFDQYGKLFDYLSQEDESLKKLFSGDDNSTAAKLIRALTDEIKTHNTVEKWRELGYKPDAHVAIYGVGLMPVIRFELSDSQAFQATIARIEGKVGEKLLTGKIGKQEYWLIDGTKMQLLFGIQGNHLVLGAAPKNASEELRKQLFGLKRPEKNMLNSDKLTELNKKYNYTPYFSGYIDFRRISALLLKQGKSTKTDEEFLMGFDGQPLPTYSPVCIQEADETLRRFPRLVFGYNEFSSKRMVIGATLELAPDLAKDMMVVFSDPVPGMGAKGEGLMDIAYAIPILKLKEFALKQAQQVIDKPYQCPELAKIFNEGAKELYAKFDQTVPPPASDILGVRVTLSQLTLKEDMKPEFSGKALLATSNPTMLTSMAQLMAPELKDFKISPDAKPVPLPEGLKIPAEYGPIYVAMSDKAIAASIGKGEETGLSAYLSAPPAQQPTFLRVGMDVSIYDIYGQLFDQLMTTKSDVQKGQLSKEVLELQRQILQMYKLFFKRLDIVVTAEVNGVTFAETIEMP